MLERSCSNAEGGPARGRMARVDRGPRSGAAKRLVPAERVPRQHGGAHRSSPPAGGHGGSGRGLVGITRNVAQARPGSAVLG